MGDATVFTIEVTEAKPTTLFLIAGNDAMVYAHRDKYTIKASDSDAERWIRYTLAKLGLLTPKKE